VKAEGGREIWPQVKAIVAAGIPFAVIWHAAAARSGGGGYHIKGRKDAEHQALLDDARQLAEAGASPSCWNS